MPIAWYLQAAPQNVPELANPTIDRLMYLIIRSRSVQSKDQDIFESAFYEVGKLNLSYRARVVFFSVVLDQTKCS